MRVCLPGSRALQYVTYPFHAASKVNILARKYPPVDAVYHPLNETTNWVAISVSERHEEKLPDRTSNSSRSVVYAYTGSLSKVGSHIEKAKTRLQSYDGRGLFASVPLAYGEPSGRSLCLTRCCRFIAENFESNTWSHDFSI